MKNVKCARCVKCGKEYEAVPNLTNCSCGGILDIVYDYDYIKAHLTKETLKNRERTREDKPKMTRQPHEVSVFLDKVILLEKTKRFGVVILRILA